MGQHKLELAKGHSQARTGIMKFTTDEVAPRPRGKLCENVCLWGGQGP